MDAGFFQNTAISHLAQQIFFGFGSAWFLYVVDNASDLLGSLCQCPGPSPHPF
jgi:hypothetical protein